VTGRPADAEHLRDLARLRRVRDRMTRRIERAMALLRRGDLSVTEVCFEVGCSSLGTFSTRFTELVGMPPSAYRRFEPRAMAGVPPCVAKQVTRPVRNREAPVPEPQLT
jgi:AraC-like DNA-binding protein